MSWRLMCKCDVCGVVRGEANHWILYSQAAPRGFISFGPWSDDAAKTHGHLCGEQCANKLLHRRLRPALEEAAAEEVDAEGPTEVTAPALSPRELTYEAVTQPICEFCGPQCYGGADHRALAAGNARSQCGGGAL